MENQSTGDLCFGSILVSMLIRVRIYIQGFDDQKLGKNYSGNVLFIFLEEKLQFRF
jgi:hypothetical protein